MGIFFFGTCLFALFCASGVPRSVVFAVFGSSGCPEARFLSDSDFPSGGKRSFWVILNFPLGGNAVFGQKRTIYSRIWAELPNF